MNKVWGGAAFRRGWSHSLEDRTRTRRHDASKVLRDFARAAGCALVFSLPMLMTMELWWLGFYLDPLRLTLLVLTAVPVLVVLSRHEGEDVGEEDLRLTIHGYVEP